MKKKTQKPKQPRVKPAKVSTYFVKTERSPENLPSQALAIVQAVDDLGGRATREAIIKKMKVKTDQSPSRIFSYYKKTLTAGRYLKTEKDEKPASVTPPVATATPAQVQAPAPAAATAPAQVIAPQGVTITVTPTPATTPAAVAVAST